LKQAIAAVEASISTFCWMKAHPAKASILTLLMII
jgi:hypothetical protein